MNKYHSKYLPGLWRSQKKGHSWWKPWDGHLAPNTTIYQDPPAQKVNTDLFSWQNLSVSWWLQLPGAQHNVYWPRQPTFLPYSIKWLQMFAPLGIWVANQINTKAKAAWSMIGPSTTWSVPSQCCTMPCNVSSSKCYCMYSGRRQPLYLPLNV